MRARFLRTAAALQACENPQKKKQGPVIHVMPTPAGALFPVHSVRLPFFSAALQVRTSPNGFIYYTS